MAWETEVESFDYSESDEYECVAAAFANTSVGLGIHRVLPSEKPSFFRTS